MCQDPQLSRRGTQPKAVSGSDVRVPSHVPPFTLAHLRRAIPAHCFERSLMRSSLELARDVAICTLLFLVANFFIDSPSVPRLVAYGLLWPSYWFWQGAFGTGIWVMAHECGHGAFSSSKTINDAVGLIFHSLLLVPYYSWKHSHRRHHQNTGSLENDEVFTVSTTATGTRDHELWGNPLYRLAFMVFMFTIGWPLYLLTNRGGRPYDRFANHYFPSSPIFSKSERHEVIISDVAIGVVLSGLVYLASTHGLGWLVKMYVIPLMVVNFWLVLITLLQHTHPALPHYDSSEWVWLRGALSTVDRSYTRCLDWIFHRIADTHVTHHLFSQLPHYHAEEATRAIIPILGDFYARDNRNIMVALWQDFRECLYVSPDKTEEHVYWYRSATDAAGLSKGCLQKHAASKAQ